MNIGDCLDSCHEKHHIFNRQHVSSGLFDAKNTVSSGSSSLPEFGFLSGKFV